MIHPLNKQQRKVAADKHKLTNEKKITKDRAGKVWHKLATESSKIKETDDELKEFKH